MKKLLLIFASAICICHTMMPEDSKMQARRAEIKKEDSIAYKTALMSIEQHNWVLEATEISYTGGLSVSVSSNINYISVDSTTVTLQTASDSGNNGFNGLGGATVNGTIDSEKQTFSKDGALVYEFHVQGVSLQASVTITLQPGNNYASAYIDFDTNTDSMTLYGNIVRFTGSGEVEGESQY